MNTDEESWKFGAEWLCLDLAYPLMSDFHLLSLLAVERSDIGHLPNNKLLFWPWGMTTPWQDMLKGDFDLSVIQYTHLKWRERIEGWVELESNKQASFYLNFVAAQLFFFIIVATS